MNTIAFSWFQLKISKDNIDIDGTIMINFCKKKKITRAKKRYLVQTTECTVVYELIQSSL